MEAGKPPGPSAHQFLWLCVKNTEPLQAPDWKVIGPACNTTPGAASKRFSRLKQAMAAGAPAPGVGSGDADEPTTPKRKRVAKNVAKGTVEIDAVDENDASGLGGETSGHDGDVDVPKPAVKRTKTAAKDKAIPKPKATPKPKPALKPKLPKSSKTSKGSAVEKGVNEDIVVSQEVPGDQVSAQEEYTYMDTFESDLRVSDWLEGI